MIKLARLFRAARRMTDLLNALSFDVEDYFQVSAFNGAISRNAWDEHPLRVAKNTRVLLDLLAEHGVKATFYTLGWVAEREPEMVKAIAAAGHEVACHGYSHKLVYDQTPEEFAEETRRSKSVLEDLSQAPVTSYRAASYSITRASLWALDVLCEQGFTTDSSIFPIRHDRYGLVGGPLQPHYLELPGGGRILEFPISTLRVAGVNLPVSGGGYFRLYPYGVSRYLARQVNAQNRPFVFYLHPWEVDPDQPRVDVNALTRFRHYNNLAKCHQRLDRLLRDFRFGTVSAAIAAHYGRNANLPVHAYPPVHATAP
jgi:polysaccharide deacetylase family protein (PEP-CTERM system associated)